MGTLVGRERELRTIASVLDQARAQQVARIIRLVGASGIGKTALLQRVLEDARDAGWLPVYANGHRIQAALPLIVARRAASAVLRELGGDADRYVSGLEGELAAITATDGKSDKALENGLFQLVNAVLLDRPLLLTIDDAQWSDAESRSLFHRLLQAFSDRPIVLLAVERSDDAPSAVVDFADEVLMLRELNARASEELVRDLLPGASDAVVRAAVDQTRGRPIDITTIANLGKDPETMTEADVGASVRAIIAKEVALLEPATREFLQMCSLIGEPIEYELLKALWPEDDALHFIDETSGRYLVQEDNGLRFVHAAIAQSIEETIPIEIPYRRRLIKAMEQLPHRPERYERLVEQAAACGDRKLEREYLLKLADEASTMGLFTLFASALERAIALTPFNKEDALPLYSQLSLAYNMLSREADTIRVCREGLERAATAGLREDTGQLAASLLFAMWNAGDRNDFYQTYTRYESQLSAPQDLGLLHLVGMYAAACDVDNEAFERRFGALSDLKIASPIFDVRVAAFRGLLSSRSTTYNEGQTYFSIARSTVEQYSLPLLKTMVDIGALIVAFFTFGASHPEVKSAIAALPQDDDVRITIEALELLSTGSPRDAIEIIGDSIVYEVKARPLRTFLGLAGAAASLSSLDQLPRLRSQIEVQANIALRGIHSPTFLPCISAAAHMNAQIDRAQCHRFIDAALTLASAMFEPQICWIPIVLVQAAAQSGHKKALQLFAERSLPHDSLPWNRAQYELAECAASAALGTKRSQAEINTLSSQFVNLGAPFFARLLEASTNSLENRATRQKDAAKLSRRESEVAELIANGATNREIAERLVLSERTVEGHIANIFAKLNVGSRSQIATWFVRKTALLVGG